MKKEDSKKIQVIILSCCTYCIYMGSILIVPLILFMFSDKPIFFWILIFFSPFICKLSCDKIFEYYNKIIT